MTDHEPGPQDPTEPTLAGAKLALRDQLATQRSRLPLGELGDRSLALAKHVLQAPEVRRAATVTAYVSVHREPGTTALLDGLRAAGKRVLLPIVLPDLDLDWAAYGGPADLVSARMGLLEPAGPRLGVAAVSSADAVLVPGVAVDRVGNRLGRGGGCYDRALSRVASEVFTCALLHSEEVVDHVPVAPHDRPVTAVATELGVRRFSDR